ncbi:3-hydroxyisobutyrate dehydrogenase-like beta-hydroxyacid dehydrogenase [Nocardia tenerifensis]|uniref:3-hydroxyisobutyrate dehydrogenase-like beta-hydroxyacid dehydrogenase n=1 Tax=Nocardia tenerifensis TaxID=228006 RepID=A0A318JPH8_9NOCA|nr:NAD(P)-binding domain-containing protein [Nocardia tenerifensis]PXX57588.1 3-hydroxyisobutyrate dehydrogenase-like beta-hydroxyacid dehydrogenase [Nocardia tenerifensis]
MPVHAEKSLTVLGLGDMGSALIRSWLAAGYAVTVWNRSARSAPNGASVAATAAQAVAANGLVVVCLLDDASVRSTLDDLDLTGRDIVNLTTSTPAEARALSDWIAARGGRFLDGGIMAVPSMIGVAGSGAYIFYSGSAELHEIHGAALAVPAGVTYVGADAGFAALYDMALLSAMWGMFAGAAHAFALIRGEDISPVDFAPLMVGYQQAMAGYAYGTAAQLVSGDYTEGVESNLAMMVTTNGTLLRTAAEQGVSPELLTPFMRLMERRVAEGGGRESNTGVIDLLRRQPALRQ